MAPPAAAGEAVSSCTENGLDSLKHVSQGRKTSLLACGLYPVRSGDERGLGWESRPGRVLNIASETDPCQMPRQALR